MSLTSPEQLPEFVEQTKLLLIQANGAQTHHAAWQKMPLEPFMEQEDYLLHLSGSERVRSEKAIEIILEPGAYLREADPALPLRYDFVPVEQDSLEQARRNRSATMLGGLISPELFIPVKVDVRLPRSERVGRALVTRLVYPGYRWTAQTEAASTEIARAA